MSVRNAGGPEPLDLRSPARATPRQLRSRLDDGEWVVDLRSRKAYVESHLFGTVSLVLDVRMTNEWRASHVEGAVHIPLYELPQRVGEAPTGTVWVHCGSGYRAAAAAALLEAAGREPVLVDDFFGNAAGAGVGLTSGG